MKPLYITAAIDYVNAKPHVGHALEKIQADVAARYWRGRGRDVFYLSGTDEQSLKNVRAAQRAGQAVTVFVDEMAATFIALKKQFNLSLDAFIRTTEDRHVAGAQKFWRAFKPADLYRKKYRGRYCVGCEEFKLDKDLTDGVCPDHRTKPETVEEENYFFRLTRFQKKLEELIAGDRLKITPEFRKNEILAFLREGLADLSVSRTRERAEGWGVPVPGDAGQIMYVWVDALSNYLTALDYATNGPLYRKYWAGDGERVHLIGKNILRFHAIYWPAFLLSAELPLPTKIVVHEFFTLGGQKMSKSLGNVIAPPELAKRYGRDGARYLLLAALPADRDGDISWEKLDARYTADLVNDLGNLVQRTLVLRRKLAIKIPKGAAPSCAEADRLTEEFRFAEALAEIWNLVRAANRQLDREAPWSEADPTKRTKTLTTIIRQLETIATALEPYLPETAEIIHRQLASEPARPLFPRLPASGIINPKE